VNTSASVSFSFGSNAGDSAVSRKEAAAAGDQLVRREEAEEEAEEGGVADGVTESAAIAESATTEEAGEDEAVGPLFAAGAGGGAAGGAAGTAVVAAKERHAVDAPSVDTAVDSVTTSTLGNALGAPAAAATRGRDRGQGQGQPATSRGRSARHREHVAAPTSVPASAPEPEPEPEPRGYLDRALDAHAEARRWCPAGGSPRRQQQGGESGAALETDLLCATQLRAVWDWARERLATPGTAVGRQAPASTEGAAGAAVSQATLLAPLLAECGAADASHVDDGAPASLVGLLRELRSQRALHRRVCSTVELCAQSMCGDGKAVAMP